MIVIMTTKEKKKETDTGTKTTEIETTRKGIKEIENRIPEQETEAEAELFL